MADISSSSGASSSLHSETVMSLPYPLGPIDYGMAWRDRKILCRREKVHRRILPLSGTRQARVPA